jgi:hypothetical protein
MRGDGGFDPADSRRHQPFEKAALVANIKGARDRKRRETGKCGGCKSYAELSPETVALAKRLARYPVNGRKRSLRDVAAELQTAGRVSRNGTPYGAAAISAHDCLASRAHVEKLLARARILLGNAKALTTAVARIAQADQALQ